MLISPSPLSLTTHRRHLRIVPPHLVHRFASRTFLVLLANLIDISQFLTPSATLPSPRPFLSPRPQGLLSFHLLEGGGPLSSCPAAEQKSERERRRGRWPVDRTERRRGIFLPSNRTSESSSSSSSSMGQRRSAPLPAGTLCASCKYLSAYCITRHDNVRPRLRLSLPAPLPPPSLVLPPPSLYRG